MMNSPVSWSTMRSSNVRIIIRILSIRHRSVVNEVDKWLWRTLIWTNPGIAAFDFRLSFSPCSSLNIASSINFCFSAWSDWTFTFKQILSDEGSAWQQQDILSYSVAMWRMHLRGYLNSIRLVQLKLYCIYISPIFICWPVLNSLLSVNQNS